MSDCLGPVRVVVLVLALVLILIGAAACTPETSTDDLSGMQLQQLRLGSVLGETDLVGFARAEQPRTFHFPADHGPHPAFRSEWWYLTLVLEDDVGADVGVQFTLFRQALTPEVVGESAPAPQGPTLLWDTSQVYLAHFAVTDVASAQHLVHERFARGHPELAGARAEPFAVWLEDWRLEAIEDEWRLVAGTPGLKVDVRLSLGVDPVLQGEAGLSRKGEDQASYYYSMPRMPVIGQIEIDGQGRSVQGLGWLDREWSTSILSDEQTGWDWFALQLDDGRSIMVFQLRRQDGQRDVHDHGVLVESDGGRRLLDAEDFELKPTRFWEDDEGVAWPVAWRVSVDDEVWQVEAVLDDQKMVTSVRYWEGLVVVRQTDAEVGRGYLELTGYDR